MRAIVVNELGGPEVLTLEERPDPEAGPGDLLVDVAAGGVNFIDIYQRTGIYPMELPYVVGSEGAGTVTAVGAEVSELAVGDRVTWAMSNGTGYTDTAVVPAAKAVADVKGTTIIGGGDSVAAVTRAGVADRLTHISTGGGASLEFLAGEKLPGVEALEAFEKAKD